MFVWRRSTLSYQISITILEYLELAFDKIKLFSMYLKRAINLLVATGNSVFCATIHSSQSTLSFQRT